MNLLLIFTLFPVFIFMMFIPYWTRKTESFGISIPEKIYPTNKLKDMRKSYTIMTGVFSIIIAGTFLLLNIAFNYNDNTLGVIFSVLIIVYLIGSFFIYLKFHRQMKLLKQSEYWTLEKSQMVVVDTTFHKQKLTFSNLWFIISLIITFITIAITLRFYDHIPNLIPMNYNFSGNVTNWADKSLRSVFLMPVMQLFMIGLFLFINIMIAKAKQQISAEDPKRSTKQNITFRRRWSAFLIVMGTAMVFMFALIQASFIFPVNQSFIWIASLVITSGTIIGAIILSITTGQGGSRVHVKENINGTIIDRDDDQHWKLGQFYFNKNDPSIFLEKRFGIGWTNNWAHPLSWVFLIGIIVLAAGIPILLTM